MATRTPNLLCAIDINLCGVGICVKNFKGDIKHWIMLYFDTNDAHKTYTVLNQFFSFHNVKPDTFIIEKIYWSKMKGISKLFSAEGIARGVIASLFPEANIYLVPSVSYKTHYKLAKGNHEKNKEAVVQALKKEIDQWFKGINESDQRIHEHADCLLLCKYIEDTLVSK